MRRKQSTSDIEQKIVKVKGQMGDKLWKAWGQLEDAEVQVSRKGPPPGFATGGTPPQLDGTRIARTSQSR